MLAGLSRRLNMLTSSTFPSMLLVIGQFGATIRVLHLLPEDGSIIERFSLTSSSTTFRDGGATEQAREVIGTVTLHVGDGETAESFLDDVETRISRLQNDSANSSPQTGSSGEVTQLVQDVLLPATLDAIHEREERDRSVNATQTFSVFVVYINRSRAGRIQPDELTSFPQSNSHRV